MCIYRGGSKKAVTVTSLGDVIVSVNQVPVTTAREVTRDVSKAEKSGRKSVLFLVRRNGTQTFVAVPLGNA